MTDDELKKVQMIELDILKETIRICKKHNIEFFATAGTALGAHFFNGIMPWDDDIDIGMRRSEYERFVEIAEKELSDEYFLQTKKTDKYYPFRFAKIKRKNTSYVVNHEKEIKMHHGIYIDVFPFDITTWNKKKRFIQALIVCVLERILLVKHMSFREVLKQKTIRMASDTILKFLSKIIYAKIIDKSLYYWSNKYSLTGESCLCELRAQPKIGKVFIDAEKMYPIIKFKFEDIEIPMLNNYEELFKNQYGKVVKYPAMEKRRKHNLFYISFNNEYTPD